MSFCSSFEQAGTMLRGSTTPLLTGGASDSDAPTGPRNKQLHLKLRHQFINPRNPLMNMNMHRHRAQPPKIISSRCHWSHGHDIQEDQNQGTGEPICKRGTFRQAQADSHSDTAPISLFPTCRAASTFCRTPRRHTPGAAQQSIRET
jgi:hypothetical protein